MFKQYRHTATDLGLLLLRANIGGLLAGHGAQKLFGAFGGGGVQGTSTMMEKMNLKPGEPWALLAGASELGSGVLMALGLLSPLGSIASAGPLITAWAEMHGDKPIWSTKGGGELALLYLAGAAALGFTGPGRISADEALGVRVPDALVGLAALGVAAGLAATLLAAEPVKQPSTPEPAGQPAPNAAQARQPETREQAAHAHEVGG